MSEAPHTEVDERAPGGGPSSVRSELASDAPCIGSIRPLPSARVGPGARSRVSSIELDGLAAGRFEVAAASVVGTGHAIEGDSRQDSYAFGVSAEGTVYVSVADGLGSRAASHVGSRLLTAAAVADALEHAESDVEDLAASLLRAAERAGEVAWESFSLDARAVACVGALAAIGPDGIRVVRAGDVTAFSLTKDGFVELFAVDSAFINNVSTTLPGAGREDLEIVRREEEPIAYALVSDGVANDLRSSPGLRTWLADRWSTPRGPYAMGDTLRYRRQGSHDDRTAVVVWPQRSTEPPATPTGDLPIEEVAARTPRRAADLDPSSRIPDNGDMS